MPAVAEFWILLAFYVKSLSSEPQATQVLEDRILPLLDHFEFLENCEDIGALRSIIENLHHAGLGIPFDVRRALACKLLQRALASVSRDSARDYIVFAMHLVDQSFHAIISAIGEAKPADNVDKLEFMLCVVEEELCRNIVDESKLLQHVNQVDSTSTRIESLLRKGLNSERDDVRVQTLRLGLACSLHSRAIFSTLQPIFEAALYFENFEVREIVLAGLMDMIYLHHQDLDFHDVRHYIAPFLYAPTAKLQYCAVIGCGRILLENCFPEDNEQLLSAMLERQVYSIPSNIQETRLEPVTHAIHAFFESYAPGHQDEIANALVYLCLEKIEAGVIMVDSATCQVRYNSNKRQEGRGLQLALKFGLDISAVQSQTVMEGLAANLDNVTTESCLGLLHWAVS